MRKGLLWFGKKSVDVEWRKKGGRDREEYFGSWFLLVRLRLLLGVVWLRRNEWRRLKLGVVLLLTAG